MEARARESPGPRPWSTRRGEWDVVRPGTNRPWASPQCLLADQLKNGREIRLMEQPTAPALPIAPVADNPEPLASAHTPNFPGLLESLGISLAVSTYQAGRLVFIRAEGD